jgi:hypothetical protein
MMDGPSHITLHCFIKGDGSSGDLNNYILLDPATMVTPSMPKRQDLIVKQVWYEMTGFSLIFSFNATQPWPFWVLTPGASLKHDWRFFGGIRDRSDYDNFGIDSDGKLLISTKGLSANDDTCSFVLWMEKRDRPNPQLD